MLNVFFGTLETVLMCKHSEYLMIYLIKLNSPRVVILTPIYTACQTVGGQWRE